MFCAFWIKPKCANPFRFPDKNIHIWMRSYVISRFVDFDLVFVYFDYKPFQWSKTENSLNSNSDYYYLNLAGIGNIVWQQRYGPWILNINIRTKHRNFPHSMKSQLFINRHFDAKWTITKILIIWKFNSFNFIHSKWSVANARIPLLK